MSIEQSRQPAGVPVGGRYATGARGESDVALAPPPLGSLRFAPLDDEVARTYVERLGADHEVWVAERVLESIRQSIGNIERQIARTLGPVPTPLRKARATAMKLAGAAAAAHADALVTAAEAGVRADAAAARYPWGDADPATIFTMDDGIQRPVTVAPSGRWGFYTPPVCRPPGAGPVAGLAWVADGGRWVGSPGHHARTMAVHDPARPFSYIEHASLSVQDTAAYVAFARTALERQGQTP